MFDKDAPKHVSDTYDKYYQRYANKGHSEANKRSLRHVNLSGYYKGSKGWTKKHDDLNSKVGISEAVLQPDGTYVIEGICSFQPNSVKPGLTLKPEDIRKMIANTNRSIANGGQKPAVTIGHASPDMALLGEQQNANGFAINWREMKGRPGWAECDLVGVPKEQVERLQKKQLSGLSIGLAKDAGNLNLRVAHLALLGASSAALSNLPVSEIFTSRNTINFSADSIETHFLPIQRKTMKLTDKHKECYKALQMAFASYEAAEKSIDASEPEAESKLGDAAASIKTHFKSMAECFDSEMTPGNESGPTDGPSSDSMNNSADATKMANEKISDVTTAPSDGEYTAQESPHFRADPEAAFAVAEAKRTQLERMVQALQLKVKSQENKEKWSDFSAEAESLRKEGRLLPTSDILKGDFDLCFQSRDPAAALTHRLKAYRSIPAQSTPATVNKGQPVFSANDSNKPTVPANAGDKMSTKEIHEFFPEFTEQDMIWASIGNEEHVGRTIDF